MAFKNNTQHYGSIAKWLHWLIAILFLASYCTIYYRHWFTENETFENWLTLQLHLSVGISIGTLVILRIIWRLMNRPPQLEPGTKLEHRMAHSGHFILYVMMVAMPISGYLGTGVDNEFFMIFTIPGFQETAAFSTLVFEGLGLTFEEFEAPVDFFHKEIMGAWLVWLLIAGHITFALYHHFFKKDRTLKRMLPGARN